MIGIVRVALKRPYTFVVLAILILIVGPLAALRTPTDIFPDIDIPVISVVWQYTGLSPDQMEGRVMAPFERVLTTTVNNVAHLEGNSLTGYGIVKISSPARTSRRRMRKSRRLRRKFSSSCRPAPRRRL